MILTKQLPNIEGNKVSSKFRQNRANRSVRITKSEHNNKIVESKKLLKEA